MQFATNLNPTVLFDHARRLRIWLTPLDKHKNELGPIFKKWIERSPNVRLIEMVVQVSK